MSTTAAPLSADDSPVTAPLFVPYARLPLWRRALVLAGLLAPAVVWGREAHQSPRDALVMAAFLIGPVVAAMGLSFVNHPGAQLLCRGAAWFQLLIGTVAAVSSHAWEPVAIALGAGLALLAIGTTGLAAGEATRGSFAPVAFRRSLMVSLVMGMAEIQGLSAVSSTLMHESGKNQLYAASLGVCAVVLAVGVVGLYRLRVWGLLMHLLAMVGLASIVVSLVPGTTSEVSPLFVWFATVTVQMLVPLPMVLAIVSRRRVAPVAPSPWPARLFRGLVVAMMTVAVCGALTHRSF